MISLFFSFKLHLSHSFAYITPPPLIMTWNIDRQQHFHLFYRSCYLQNAYIWLLFLLRLNDFKYHRRLLLWFERKANKPDWIPITVRERNTSILPSLFFRAIIFLIIAISHHSPLPPSSSCLLLICDPGHKQEVIIHLCLPNY